MRAVRISLGMLLSAVTAGAQLRPGLLESLVKDSPFQSGPGGTPPADGGSASFEFRGIVAEAGGYSFSVYDPGRREAGWVKLDEPGRSFVARRYDPAQDTLTIEQNGRAVTLNLKRAPVQPLNQASLPPASPPPLPTAGAAPPAAGNTPPPSTNATNAQEAQRLQNIADEIRRRRGLRQMPPVEKPAGKP